MKGKGLNLPIIKTRLPGAKHLSMDDYLKFVNLHLRYTLNREADRDYRRKSIVKVPFSLK